MATQLKYIFVDDDPVNNWLYRFIVKEAVGEADIKTFTEPGEALEFIQNQYGSTEEPTVLFLDINMPVMSGWEFLERYEKFSAEIKTQINVYVFSSSSEGNDRNKARDNKNVTGFISKPLTKETIISIAKKDFVL